MSTVHLSFDNGPHPIGTPAVLDVLRRHKVRATFFVLGKFLDTPDGMALARRIVDEGHRLGHHSYSHEVPLGEDDRADAILVELQRTHDLLRTVWTGPRWFRPFGGGGKRGPHLLSARSTSWMKAHGYTIVLWNSVPGDWLRPDDWLAQGLADVQATDHTAVVLHDTVPDAMVHLDAYLKALKRLGCAIVDDWPDDCLVMVDGVARPGLDACVSGAQRSQNV